MSDDAVWAEAARAHQQAVARYLETARGVGPSRWEAAPREGKWSPAEVTQHLVLTYRGLAAEQQGTLEIPVLLTAPKAWLLRHLVLPRLLAGRPFPPGVKAPREARPRGPLPPRDALLDEFQASADAFDAAFNQARGRRGSRATHPFFGRLPLRQMYRFASLHTEHHRRQLEWACHPAGHS